MTRALRTGLLLAACSLAPAAEENVVSLPPFIVEENAHGPPWRYADGAGFEVLSRCPEDTTRELVETFYRLHQVLAEILPESLQYRMSTPRTFIFYDEAGGRNAAAEIVAQMMAQVPTADRDDLLRFDRAGRASVAAPKFRFLPNLRLWDRDAMCVFSLIGDGEFDLERLALTPDYINYLVRNRVPALPAWFVSGFLAQYHDAAFDGDEVTLPPIEWGPLPKKSAAGGPPLVTLPLADFFAYDLSRAAAAGLDGPRLWNAQAALLVRWGLDTKDRARRQAFFDFVAHAAVQSESEELFRAKLGLGYAEAQRQLDAYLPGATRHRLAVRRGEAPPPRFAIRLATDVEISRIKGDWERMEVEFVTKKYPAVADKYAEQAMRTLRHAYDHDSRDPQLLAVLGLCAVDQGDATAARGYLEAAAQRSATLRPRAEYELARLRLAALHADLAGTEAAGRLTAEQTYSVLVPLFAARAEKPPLPEVYQLIADVWDECAVRPSRGHLAVIEEGARLFPRRLDLVQHAASLYVKHGYLDSAAWLVDLGLRTAPDDATRARFAALAAQLPPAQGGAR